MNLSIITVNYRSWGHLENALDGLKKDFPENWQIIVVDNQSDPEMLGKYVEKYPWVNFIGNPNNSGFGFGCRIGVAQAEGKQFLFMNPDVIASCTEIQQLISVKAANPDIAIVAPKQTDSQGHPQKVFDEFPDMLNQSKILKSARRLLMPRRFPNPRIDYSELKYCDWVTGSVLLIDRADYEKIDGWSTDYWMYVEDADLCRKAHNAGMRVAYTPEVVVVHAHGGSSRLNVDVKAMTKLEVIISKHVYTNKHAHGIARPLTHFLIFLTRYPLLLLSAAFDLVTLRKLPVLRVRGKMLAHLTKYYFGVMRSGSWLSPRAKANQEE